MTTTKAEQRAYLLRKVAQQRRWIEDHGNDLAGYVARYGSRTHPNPSHPNQTVIGDGGEAIYRADKADLDQLVRELAALVDTPEAFTDTVKGLLS